MSKNYTNKLEIKEIIWRQDSTVDIGWKVIQSTCYLYSDYYCIKSYKVDAVRKEVADALKLSFVLSSTYFHSFLILTYSDDFLISNLFT